MKLSFKNFICLLGFMVFCGIANTAFGQNNKETEKADLKEIPVAVDVNAPLPAPKIIKKLGDYTIKEVDGVNVVYDPNGVPLLLRADDFEKIYLEQESKKKPQ